MVRVSLVVVSCFVAVQGFVSPVSHPTSRTFNTGNGPLHTLTSSQDNFGDDMEGGKRRGNEGGDMNFNRRGVQEEDSKFVTGDELHRLRHEVLAHRLELQEARRSGSKDLVAELEKSIMKAQQVDAEFVYTVSLQRMELAQQKGRFNEAEAFKEQAMEARAALPQFNLEGLWVGKYGEHGYEMINVTYHGDVLIAQKVTGTKNVPKGQVTFEADLSPNSNQDDVLEPIELGEGASRQWGCKYLQRFGGRGQVSAEGFHDSQWVDGQLIMVNEYFSFAWLPIGHQVFFGRPSPELVLKLLKDDKKQEHGGCTDRSYLEKCWEETEHIEDDHEVSSGPFSSINQHDYYQQEGCFE